MTRRFWILGALIIAALAIARIGPAVGQTLGIAAVVNDEVISVHDLESRIDLLIATSNMPPTPETRQRLDSHVLRLLIEEALKMQEARRLNISVSREELAGALERIAGQVGVPPERMSEALASRGTDIQALIDQVEAEIAWIKTVQARTGGELTVDDEEVTARLQQLESRAGEPEVRVAEIFLPVSDRAQENEIQALMQRLANQLAEGVSFRSLARNFSQGPTAAGGGDLGWMELDQFDPELRDILADLPPGQAYGPVRTALGYYIVFMIDRRVVQPPQAEATVLRLQQVALPLPPNPGAADVRTQMRRLLDVSTGAGSCAELVTAASRAGAATRELEGVPLNRLDDQLRELVEPLGAGEKTPPLAGQDGVALFMVCERRREDMTEQLRERVREALLQERLATESRRLLRELRREAFVDVRI